MHESREAIFKALRNKEITVRAAVLMIMQLKLSEQIQKELSNENH